MKILLLGLGNDLYGDDGVGIHVVRELRRRLEDGQESLATSSEVSLQECGLSGLSLLDVIVGYDALVIIDTIKREHPFPGRIHVLEEGQLRAIPGPSPHYVSIPQTLAMGSELGLHVPSKIAVIAVEAKNIYQLGEGLTAQMVQAIPQIIQKVKDVLKEM